MILDKFLEGRGRFSDLVKVLQALADQELDLDLFLGLRAGVEGLLVELQGLGVVGLLLFLGRLEETVGEFQIDVCKLLLAFAGEQVFGLGPIDQFGAAEVAFAGQRDGLGETHAACPRAGGKLLGELIKDRNGLVVLAVQMQCPAFEIPEVVAGGVFVGQCGFDRLHRVGIAAVLHGLADFVCHQGGVGRRRAGSVSCRVCGWRAGCRVCRRQNRGQGKREDRKQSDAGEMRFHGATPRKRGRSGLIGSPCNIIAYRRKAIAGRRMPAIQALLGRTGRSRSSAK